MFSKGLVRTRLQHEHKTKSFQLRYVRLAPNVSAHMATLKKKGKEYVGKVDAQILAPAAKLVAHHIDFYVRPLLQLQYMQLWLCLKHTP